MDVTKVIFDWLDKPAIERDKTPREMRAYLRITRITWRKCVEEWQETERGKARLLRGEKKLIEDLTQDLKSDKKFDVKKTLKDNLEVITKEFIKKCIEDAKPDHLKLFYQLTGIMEEKTESTINLGELARVFSEVKQEMEAKKSQLQLLNKQKNGSDVDSTQNTLQETTSAFKIEQEQPQSNSNPGTTS